MTESPRCVCGHKKIDHHAKTKACMFVASIESRSKRRYGRGRKQYIQCACKRFRPVEEK